MVTLLVALVVSLLWLWPIVSSAGEAGRTGQPVPEQRQFLAREWMQQVQERLKAAGLDPGPIDGTMSPQTEAALRTYQQQHGLPASGVPDEATLQRLQVFPDAAQAAQTRRTVPVTRPEQQITELDRSEAFQAAKALPSSPDFANQPDQGKVLGFDFFRDPLNAMRPMQILEEILQADSQAKPAVMDAQRRLSERRYDLTPRFGPAHRMSRGKPIAVGATARLGQGHSWESLARLAPAAIRQGNLFPYPPLPHPKQATGGQVFPHMQILMFPRLERFDVDFDLPEAFLPEFPPALFLQQRPELGDVSRGEVVSINNFYRLFKDLLTPV